MSERSGGGYWGNKVDSIIGKTSGSETSVFYYVIY